MPNVSIPRSDLLRLMALATWSQTLLKCQGMEQDLRRLARLGAIQERDYSEEILLGGAYCMLESYITDWATVEALDTLHPRDLGTSTYDQHLEHFRERLNLELKKLKEEGRILESAF